MQESIKELVHKHRLQEAKKIHRAFVFFSPIFLVFAIGDYFNYRELFPFFLSMRLGYLVFPLIFNFFVQRTNSFNTTQVFAITNAAMTSIIITVMIFARGGLESYYFFGLNLIGLVALTFFTFTELFFIAAVSLIYLPYFIIAGYQASGAGQLSLYVFQALVAATTVACSYMVHIFRERYRLDNLMVQLRLSEELAKRNQIIDVKTKQAVKLTHLASQFSPQVVDSIQNGHLTLETGGRRNEICAMFIDVVNSTERVNTINEKKFEKVISYFMDHAAECLIKNNVTIVQFMGDGLICVSNAPNSSPDYVDQMAKAALEIAEHVNASQSFYEPFWQKPFQIRIGMAKGFANVGFFGHEKYFKSFTAIGPVMNLSARLCSSAEVNQVLVDNEVFEALQNKFDFEFKGKRQLKGFDEEIIYTYSLKNIKNSNLQSPNSKVG